MRRMRIRAAPNIGGVPKKAQPASKAPGTSSDNSYDGAPDTKSLASETKVVPENTNVLSPPMNLEAKHEVSSSSLSSERTDLRPVSPKCIEETESFPPLSTLDKSHQSLSDLSKTSDNSEGIISSSDIDKSHQSLSDLSKTSDNSEGIISSSDIDKSHQSLSDLSKTSDNSEGIISSSDIVSIYSIDDTVKAACGSQGSIEFKDSGEIPVDPVQIAQTAGTGTKMSFMRRQKIKALPQIGRPRKGPPHGDSKTCVVEQKKQEKVNTTVASNIKNEKTLCYKEVGAFDTELDVPEQEDSNRNEKVECVKEEGTSYAKSHVNKQKKVTFEDEIVPSAIQTIIPTVPMELVNSNQDIGKTINDLTLNQPKVSPHKSPVSFNKKESAMDTSVNVDSSAVSHSILPERDLKITKLPDKSSTKLSENCSSSENFDTNSVKLGKEPDIICEDPNRDSSSVPIEKVQESLPSSDVDTVLSSPHPLSLPSHRARKHTVPALSCKRTFGKKDRFAGENRLKEGEAVWKERPEDGNEDFSEEGTFDGAVRSRDNIKGTVINAQEITDNGKNNIITIEKLPEDQLTPSKITSESQLNEIGSISSCVIEVPVQKANKSSSDEPKLKKNVIQSNSKPLLPLTRRRKVKASVKTPGGHKMLPVELKQESKGEMMEGEEVICSSDDGIGDKENTGSVLMVEKKVARKGGRNKDKDKVETKSREIINIAKEIKSNVKKEGKANISTPLRKVKWPSQKHKRKLKLGSHDEDLSETIEKKFFRERKQEYRKKISAGSLEKSKMTMFDLIFWNPQTNPMPGRTESPKKRTKTETEETDVVSEKLEEERVDDLALDVVETPAEEAVPAEVAIADQPDSSHAHENAPPDVHEVPDDGSADRLQDENKESLALDTPSQDSQDTSTHENEEDSQPADEFAPRVKIGPDGKIILDEKSLTIKTTAAKNRDKILSSTKVVEENVDNTSKYGLWTKKRKRSTEWTMKETARFYKALSTVGTDFSLMETLFPWRSRSELKTKFKKEERISWDLVDRALRDSTQFDFSIFDESDYDPEEDRKATKGAEKEEKRKRRQELLRVERERKKEQKRLNRCTKKILRKLKKRRKKRRAKPVVVGSEEKEEEHRTNGEVEARNCGISSNDIPSADELDAIRTVGANEVVVTTEEEEDEEEEAGYKSKIKEKRRKRGSNSGRSLGTSLSKNMQRKGRGQRPKVDIDAVIPSTSSHKQREEESVQVTQVEVSMSVMEQPQQIWHFNSSHVQQLPDGTGTITVPTSKGKKEVKVPVLPQGSSNLMVVATADPCNPGEHLYHVYFVSPMVDNQNVTITHS
ncbi:uncharacterized protein LOC143033805 [Oratosquilla oratoria]|uniref:uncharacterized protein LOC143033805 n=1 Tax=Oratosquilla oratoria TaxID=337810 RepID=UPI003F76BAE9